MTPKMNNARLRLLIPAVTGAAFFLGVELGSFNLVLLTIVKEFSLDTSFMGILVTAQNITVAASPLVFGRVADRIGKKLTLLIFMPVFTAGCFITAFANSVFAFIGGVLVIGAGFSVCESMGSSALSDSFPGKESKFMNLMQFGFSLGAVISPLAFRLLFTQYGFSWHIVFIVSGCGFVLLYPLMLAVECRTAPSLLHTKTRNPEMCGKQVSSRAAPLRSVVQARFPGLSFFLLLVLSMMSYVAIENGVSFFVDSLLVIEYGNSSLGAWAISGFWFAMTVSRLFFASLKIKPRTMALAGFMASTVLLLILFFMKSQLIFVTITVCLGFALGPVWPMILSMGMSAFPEKSGTFGGVLYSSGGVSGIITPLLFGAIAGANGFYAAFMFLAFVSAGGLLAMKFTKR
ncbi:MAG: MFS transporter [Treponema sp.]|jgi:MFS family permease|nr:MFS transporter [Treponema sp.]